MHHFTYESNSLTGAGPSDLGNSSQLESIYRLYGQGIYTLCVRLLGDQKAAESATVDVFVQFSRDLSSQTDYSRTLLRLRELAINASLARLNHRFRFLMRCVLHNLGLQVRRLWRI